MTKEEVIKIVGEPSYIMEREEGVSERLLYVTDWDGRYIWTVVVNIKENRYLGKRVEHYSFESTR